MQSHTRLFAVLVTAALALSAVGVFAAEDAPAAAKSWVGATLDHCCWGGDIRIRQVHFDDIPIVADPPGVTRRGENHFFRFRTRLWGQWDPMENVTVKGRVVNEFREWIDPDMDMTPDVSSYDFPDELVVDNLYLEMRNLMDNRLDIRVGRQDMIYGTGKVILEGTPKDGSRTIYFDAAKLTWKGIANTTVDVFGIYNESENKLGINDFDGQPDKRDVTGYTGAFNDNTESGGGVYVKSQCPRTAMPLEAYYIYKDESAWTAVDPDLGNVPVPGREIHTLGGRLLPKLSDTVNAALEVAYQTGETDSNRDTEGWMADGVVNMTLPGETMKPVLSAGLYYLSGDDPNTLDEDEGWNPLWARWPQYSELYVYAYDAESAGRWSNLMMPHLDLSMALNKNVRAKAMVALMEANEDDGPGPGKTRGILGTVRVDFNLAEKLLSEHDKLMGHVTVEVLDPDDYYLVDDMAHFARWELTYAF
jgi:hypothetical protein